jgi:DNA polymerase-1
VPLRHEGSGDLMGDGSPRRSSPEAALAELRPLMEDASVLKVLHNAKYDLEVLSRRRMAASPSRRSTTR